MVPQRLHLVLLGLIALGSLALGLEVRVATSGELYDALRRIEVDRIVAQRQALFNFSQFENAVELTRPVELEGEGSRAPVLLVGGLRRILVGPGGALLVRNIQVAGCIIARGEIGCLATLRPGGNLTLLNLTVCDVGGQDSKTTWYNEVSKASVTKLHMEFGQQALGTFTIKDVSSSRGSRNGPKLLEDSGVVREFPRGAELRLTNITFLFECDAQSLIYGGPRQPPDLLNILLVVAVGVLSIAYAVAYRRSKAKEVKVDTPEQALARAHGVTFEAVLGKGSYGTVYKGTWEGQTVAVKVIEFASSDDAALKIVEREYQHGQASCRHLVQTLHCFTATVQHEGPALQKLETSSRGSKGGGFSSVRGRTSSSQRQASQQSSSANAETARRGSSLSVTMGYTGYVAYIVMQYVDGGTLLEVIKEGQFFSRNNSVDLRAVCATALDIARGLEHLHVNMKVLHRDLSCANVLLHIDISDPRGFRALLSDFGLSVAMQESKSYRTSPGKGTIDYMPPEAFTGGSLSFAFDIYSLGIIIYTMFLGRTPYQDMPQYKVTAMKADRATRLLLPDTIPPKCRRLIADCVQWDPEKRPTASEVQRVLEDILQDARMNM